MLPAGSPLSDWLRRLETLSPREIDLGLERVHAVMSRLSLRIPPHVFLVAGTNGKGSSVAMIDVLLRAAGLRTACYTSPHIMRYNERLVVNGVESTDDEIVGGFETIEAVRDDIPLTYFEYGTLAAFVLFSAPDVDAWVLEVGMGGRLDATNAIEPTGVLITNVSLDHREWLGNTVEAIAAEKAGVMRAAAPAVFGGSSVPQAILREAGRLGTDLRIAGRDFSTGQSAGGRWRWQGRDVSLAALEPPGLPGAFQIGNAAAVLALLEATGFGDWLTEDLVNATLPELQLTGRGQRIDAGARTWHVDVAHNPAGAEVLATTLAADKSGRDGLIAVVGILDDKDVEGMVRPLDAHVSRWIAVTARSHRAIPAPELARRIANCCNRPCLVADTVDEALELARQASRENDRILVTGSFYLVGPVLERLQLYSRPQT